MAEANRSDVSRREMLKTTGQGLLAAGFAAAVGGGAGVPLAPPDAQPPNLPIPQPPKPKVGFAIVGLGELALGQILPAFAVAESCRPVALVSGHPDKAKKVAEHYGIDPKNIYGYDNYDSIRDNPDVSVIYVVLPNSMHAEYTVRGLNAGKHVLCEKPMAVTPDECQKMVDAGRKNNRKLMIAYRLHYEPYNKAMIEMARKKQFGPIRLISASNDQNTTAPNIRLSKSTGGGPLGDVGIYCLNATRYITGEEPVEVSGMQTQPADDPRFAEVPASVAFQLRFPSGVLALCDCSFTTGRSNRYRVVCQDGSFQLDPAFGYSGQKMRVDHGNREEEVELPHVDHFAKEMDHFADCVLNDKQPLTPGEEGLADMRIIAKIQEAIDTGKTVRVEQM